MAAEEYTEFSGHPSEWWAEWLRKFFDRQATTPPLAVIQHEYCQAALHLYEGLPKNADREQFAEAIATIFEATTNHEANAERLYYLIDVIAAVKPLRGKRLLRARLNSDFFRMLSYGNVQLHWTALSALAKYDVDQQTVEYILRQTENLNDFRYGLLCLRVLSYTFNARLTYDFLTRLTPLFQDIDASLFRREIRPIIKRLGRADLVKWYQRDVLGLSGPPLSVAYGTQVRVLSDSLAKVFPWKRWTQSADPFEIIAAAQFGCNSNEISVRDVLNIARLHYVAEGEVLVTVLKTLYCADVPNQVWDIMDQSDPNFDRYGEPDVCLLYTRGERLELRKSVEPETVGILKEAKLRAEKMVEDPDPKAWANKRLAARA